MVDGCPTGQPIPPPDRVVEARQRRGTILPGLRRVLIRQRDLQRRGQTQPPQRDSAPGPSCPGPPDKKSMESAHGSLPRQATATLTMRQGRRKMAKALRTKDMRIFLQVQMAGQEG